MKKQLQILLFLLITTISFAQPGMGANDGNPTAPNPIINATSFNKLKIKDAPKFNSATRAMVQDSITKEIGWVLKSSLVGGGSVTSVTGISPITVASGTSTPVIGLNQANTSTNGFLSSTDWNTFNNKQTSLGFTPLSSSNNLNDLASTGTARVNLGIEKITTFNDANYTILSTDKVVVTNATLTANRTLTLPRANSVNAGYELIIADSFGAINGTNNLILIRNYADLIDGQTSATIGAQYAMRRLISNGVDKWCFDAGVMRISDYIGTTLTTSKVLVTDSNNKIAPSAVSTTTLGYLDATSSIQTQLNNRVKNIISDTASSSNVTGTTSETLAKTYTIAANSFSSTDFFKLLISAEKLLTNGAFTIRAKINTTNDFSTATTIATYTTTSALFSDSTLERRQIIFKSGVLRSYNNTLSMISDIVTTSYIKLNLTLNPANTFYLFISLQNVSTLDTTIISAVNLTN